MTSIDSEIDRVIVEMLERVWADYMSKPWWKRKVMALSWYLPRAFHLYL